MCVCGIQGGYQCVCVCVEFRDVIGGGKLCNHMSGCVSDKVYRVNTPQIIYFCRGIECNKFSITLIDGFLNH